MRDTAVRCDRGSYEASGMATGIDARTKYPPSPGSDIIQGKLWLLLRPVIVAWKDKENSLSVSEFILPLRQ